MRARHVMRLIAVAQDTTWPSDEEWTRRLPEWFVRSFEGHTLEQLTANTDLWDLGSWLDAMKNPGWEWWSSKASDRDGTVHCVACAYPYAIDPLICLLRAAGGADVEFEED